MKKKVKLDKSHQNVEPSYAQVQRELPKIPKPVYTQVEEEILEIKPKVPSTPHEMEVVETNTEVVIEEEVELVEPSDEENKDKEDEDEEKKRKG